MRHDRDSENDEDTFDQDDYNPEDPETYPHGLYDDDGPPEIPCPHCGRDVLEDSEQCPSCGMYLSKEDSPGPSLSGLWKYVAILALLAVLVWILG